MHSLIKYITFFFFLRKLIKWQKISKYSAYKMKIRDVVVVVVRLGIK